MATDPRTGRRWLILAALGAVHCAVLFVGPLVTDEAGLIPIHDWRFAVLVGLFPPHWLIGAVGFVGMWVGLGGGRWYVRLGLGFVGWLWLAMALVLGELMTPNWPYELSSWLLAAGLSAVVSVLASGFVRRFLGWRLTLDGVPLAETSGQRFQFRLVHLAAAVTLIAITLAIARLLNGRYVQFTMSYLLMPQFVLDWLMRVAIEAWGPALIAIATVVLTLRRRHGVLWLTALFVALIALDAAAQYGGFAYRNGVGLQYLSEVYPRLLRERLVADGAIMLSLVLSAAVLRSLGYRLEFARHEPGDSAPQHAAHSNTSSPKPSGRTATSAGCVAD
jgi:hypothetical protein